MKAMKKQKKALHIIDSFGAGGAETWLLAVAKYLHEHPELNWQFDFLLSGGVPGMFDDEVKKYGCQIFYLKYSFANFFKFRKQFRKVLREQQYDAIHDHQDFISGWHFLLGWGLLPEKRISHVHNPYNFVHNYVVNPVRWFSFRMGRWLTMRFTGYITGTSNAVMDEYGYDKLPYKKKRVAPAYCGFDIHRFTFNETAKSSLCEELQWSAAGRIGLFIGRIGLHDYDTALNQKNPDFAIMVARSLIQRDPQWRFIFVGFKGRKGEELEKEISQEGLSNQIKFLGLRNDVPKIMSASSVMIFPSLMEGLGMVAVEAQANGLKCLISNAVPKEAIVCQELVQVKRLEDGPDDWSKEVASIGTANETDRTRYNAKLLSSPYSIDNSVAYLLSLYQ